MGHDGRSRNDSTRCGSGSPGEGVDVGWSGRHYGSCTDGPWHVGD